MTELKPCPFCGGEAEILTAESMNGGYLFGIMCNDCRSRGDVYDTEAEAIAAWNTRAERTCTNLANEYKHGNFRCSECGFHGWTCDECYSHPEDWSYCPQCGAKVVGE